MREIGLQSDGKGLGEGGSPGHRKTTVTSGVKLTSQGHQEAGRGQQGQGGQGNTVGHVCGRVFCWPGWAMKVWGRLDIEEASTGDLGGLGSQQVP